MRETSSSSEIRPIMRSISPSTALMYVARSSGREIVDRLRQQLRVSLDRRQRRAQLVRRDGEELILLAVELLQRGDVADHENRADDAVAFDRRRGDGEIEILRAEHVPADRQVVGHGLPAQRARLRQVVAGNPAGRRDTASRTAQTTRSPPPRSASRGRTSSARPG